MSWTRLIIALALSSAGCGGEESPFDVACAESGDSTVLRGMFGDTAIDKAETSLGHYLVNFGDSPNLDLTWASGSVTAEWVGTISNDDIAPVTTATFEDSETGDAGGFQSGELVIVGADADTVVQLSLSFENGEVDLCYRKER